MATEKRLIDAEKFLQWLVKRFKCVPLIGSCDNDSESVKLLLTQAPTVDAVEVVHGRWELTVHEEQCNFRWSVTAECSECQHSKGEIYAGHFSGFPKDIVESLLPMYAKRVKLDNYCPNCGAKMDGDGNG